MRVMHFLDWQFWPNEGAYAMRFGLGARGDIGQLTNTTPVGCRLVDIGQNDSYVFGLWDKWDGNQNNIYAANAANAAFYDYGRTCDAPMQWSWIGTTGGTADDLPPANVWVNVSNRANTVDAPQWMTNNIAAVPQNPDSQMLTDMTTFELQSLTGFITGATPMSQWDANYQQYLGVGYQKELDFWTTQLQAMANLK